MNISQATGIIKPKDDTLDGLKAAYRQACKTYHPDINPNGLEMMKLINCAYEFLQQHLGKWCFSDAPAGPGLDEILQSIFDKIKHFRGVRSEICGAWLWLSGETWRYKKELKEQGFKWSRNKNSWYWSPDGYRKRSKRVFNMNEIRTMWGSQDLEQEPLTAMA